MSLTTLAERILIEEDDDLFQCECGRVDNCTWCRLHREAEAAGMRRDETPPQWARRFLSKDDPPAHAIVLCQKCKSEREALCVYCEQKARVQASKLITDGSDYDGHEMPSKLLTIVPGEGCWVPCTVWVPFKDK